MGSFSGTCEIIESKKDSTLGTRFSGNRKEKFALIMDEKDQKLQMLKLGHSKYIEDDLNNLFKSINIKSSSKSLDLSDQLDFSRKNRLKKSIGAPDSPRSEITEAVSLKKALRGLSISHASEVAAMKRLSKSSCSPRVSEARRITSLYRSVVVDSNESTPSVYEDKDIMVNSGSVSKHKESSSNIGQKTPPFVEVVKETSKVKPIRKEKRASLPSPYNVVKKFEPNKDVFVSTKLAHKVSSAKKLGRKGRLQIVSLSSSISGNKMNKLTRNNQSLVKPVFKKRTFARSKSKQDSASATFIQDIYDELKGDIDLIKTQLICQKCHCTMKSPETDSEQGSTFSHNVEKPISIGESCNISGFDIKKASKNVKSKNKGEFSHSSKSSHGEYSTSTSASGESMLSRSSCSNRPHMSKNMRWEAIRYVKRQNANLGLTHFNLLKKLGCGDIGTVYLAELIGANCLFAIKVMDNEYLAKRKKMPRAQTEREILRMLDHPFLPTLYSQFTSDNLSCLVMEFCPGGDLHVLRQKQPGRNFQEQAARFYVAEVLLALEYLHMLGVVYRDLKPENILVREDGHIMLTDFDLSLRCTVNPILLKSSSSSTIDPARISGPCRGSSCIDPFCSAPSCRVSCFTPRIFPASTKSKWLKSEQKHAKRVKSEEKNAKSRSLLQLVAEPTEARSNSFVGTHEYLAPEIIKGEGHGSAVDWWTFGIFLYELLYGATPFKGLSGNEETLANVVLQTLTFPDSPLVSFQARDLIRRLLVKDPENRLGYEKGAAEIKQHPFFDGMNWALIRCAVPPELPEINDYVGGFNMKNRILEYKGTNGDHIEFELF